MNRTTVAALPRALAAGASAAGAGPPLPAPTVDVQQANGTYHVTATFVIDETPAEALAVLTDYERIPAFMPTVTRSVILERANGHALIEQEAEPRLLMFSKRVHLLLDITEASDALQFSDRCGKSFSRYSGSWQIASEGTGSRITYRLLAEPAFSVPSFLLNRLLRKDAALMIERLRAEITARVR